MPAWYFGSLVLHRMDRLVILLASRLLALGSGFLMLGPFVRYCPVAWEFFLCRPLLFLIVPGVLWVLTFFVVLGAVYFCLFQY